MAFKLTKSQAAELNRLTASFEFARGALSEFLDSIASAWESEWEGKSERWQGGEGGQAAEEKINQLRMWIAELPSEGEPEIDTESLL